MDFMEIAKQYGLFVALVVYVIWDSRQREGKLIQIIATLSEEIRERLTKIETRLNLSARQQAAKEAKTDV